MKIAHQQNLQSLKHQDQMTTTSKLFKLPFLIDSESDQLTILIRFSMNSLRIHDGGEFRILTVDLHYGDKAHFISDILYLWNKQFPTSVSVRCSNYNVKIGKIIFGSIRYHQVVVVVMTSVQW